MDNVENLFSTILSNPSNLKNHIMIPKTLKSISNGLERFRILLLYTARSKSIVYI